jgi:hypothetical protein
MDGERGTGNGERGTGNGKTKASNWFRSGVSTGGGSPGRRNTAMMTMPRIDDPRPLVFIRDLRFGEADGKPLLLDLVAP